MREFIFKMRGGIWTLLFIIILFMVRKADFVQIISCLSLVLIGQLWRCWAAGCIGLYRGENVKAQKLAATGAYALMRNPLYFGNFIIGLGWSIIAGIKGVIIFAVSFIALYVIVIIPHEENFLREKFGSDYEEYCRKVKRFWPVSLKFEDLRGNFDKSIIKKSEIHTIISTLIGTLIILSVSMLI